MRTGRKFCSKKARASPGFVRLDRAAAFWHTLNSAADTSGAPSRDARLAAGSALQLFRKVAKAAS